jgi:hypothetical protein
VGDPSTLAGWGSILHELAPWATVALALLAWLQGRKNNSDIAANTKITAAQGERVEEVHTLVNGLNKAALIKTAGDKDRIAGLTGEKGDRLAADAAHLEVVTKEETDAKADAQAQTKAGA